MAEERDIVDRVLDKLDAFVLGLDPDEQVVLADLFGGDDDVAGYAKGTAWKGVRSIDFGPMQPAGYLKPFLSSGHTTGVIEYQDGTDVR